MAGRTILIFTIFMLLPLYAHTQGQIYIYRGKDYWRNNYYLKVNGETLTPSFAYHTFFVIENPGGTLTIETGGDLFTEKRVYNITLDKSKDYYIQGVAKLDFMTHSLKLHLRDEEHFSALKNKLQYISR